jgi:hypothetical protein
VSNQKAAESHLLTTDGGYCFKIMEGTRKNKDVEVTKKMCWFSKYALAIKNNKILAVRTLD